MPFLFGATGHNLNLGHVEDFAQVFNVYADQEYKATNYDTIGRLIFDLLPDRFEQLAEFVRRLRAGIASNNA